MPYTEHTGETVIHSETINHSNITNNANMSGLRKAKKYDWKDSNMSKVGSDEDRAVKKESAETEPAWQGSGQEVGLQIWRIVKFKVTHWPKKDYGKFYSGDSYIILNTYKQADSDALLFDVHFWIGKHSTQDEYGTAAYKTVELDTLLDDRPVQHREVQGHESSLFKSYFKSVQYLEGGADSGFNHVTPDEYKPRLFHFHGKGRSIEVKQIPMNKNLLDPTDVFLLDQGLSIFIWHGPEANQQEKFKAVQFARSVANEERSGKSVEVEVVDDENDDKFKFEDDEEDPEEEDEDDSGSFSPTLFKLTDKTLSDTTGELQMTTVREGAAMDDFKPEDVFIYDTGKEMFCWIGKRTSQLEQQSAFHYSHKYLMRTQHPLIPVSVIKQGKETKQFKMALTA